MTRVRDFLPGAQPEPAQPSPRAVSDDDLLGRPVRIAGDDSDYYPLSALAAALNRAPGTVRDWAYKGIIPEGYSRPGRTRNGNRRLYTRQQILMLRQLAAECGVLDNLRAVVAGSEFSRAAVVLFERLKGSG